MGRGKERSIKNKIRHEPGNVQVGWHRQDRPCVCHTRNERLPQIKGGYFALAVAVASVVGDYTVMRREGFSVKPR